jgi:hypothetical protein
MEGATYVYWAMKGLWMQVVEDNEANDEQGDDGGVEEEKLHGCEKRGNDKPEITKASDENFGSLTDEVEDESRRHCTSVSGVVKDENEAAVDDFGNNAPIPEEVEAYDDGDGDSMEDEETVRDEIENQVVKNLVGMLEQWIEDQIEGAARIVLAKD